MTRVAAVVVALLIAMGSALLAAPNVFGATRDESAVARFGACMSAQRSGQLLVMIDESGSLQDSDPAGNRVAAAKYLVEQLSQFSADSGIALDVAIAGFSDTYHTELGWTALNNTSLPTVQTSLDSFATRNTGQDTDYWLALDGARQTFADAPAPAEGKRCQALAWFTDGKIDYTQRDAVKPYAPEANLNSPEGVQATRAAAQESICRDQGLADQLRSSGIVMFGIGLAPTPEQSADFDLFKSIVTGEATGAAASCGALTDPIPGDFYLAQNIDDLLFAFDEFSTPGAPPSQQNSGSCAGVVCEEAKHRFVLDRSVRTVTVLAAADRPGLVPYVVAPDGTQVALDNGPATRDVSGVTIDFRPQSDKSVSFRMSGATSPVWQGVWALVFVDPAGTNTAQTRSSIHITGDLVPAWPEAASTALHSGTPDVPITFTVQDSQGEAFDPAGLLGQASLTAVLVDVTGAEHPVADLPKEQIAAPQVLNLTDVPPGAATLQLGLNITTADAVQSDGTVVPGTVLEPQRVDLPLTIDPPIGYPAVGEMIDFGELEGSGTLAGQLSITGAGCVWLPDDAATTVAAAPDGIGDIALSSSSTTADNCVKAEDGQQTSLPVTLTIPEAGNGVVNGTTTVMVGPADGSAEPVAVQVAFTASLLKPLNVTNFWLALIVALILGPGIPLLLLYLSKFAISRIPARGLRAQQIPIQVNGATVLRNNGTFSFVDGDLVTLVSGLDRPTRRLELDGITLRTHTGLSPFGSGFVVATAPGRAGAGGVSGAMHGKTPDAKLPLAVHNTWFVVHDPAGPADQATVVVLASADAGRAMLDRLAGEINSSLARVLSTLRLRAQPAGAGPGAGPPPAPNPFAPPSDNPFAGGGPPGGGNPFDQRAGAGYGPPSGPPGGNPFNPSNPYAPGPPGGRPNTPYPGGDGGDANNPFR